MNLTEEQQQVYWQLAAFVMQPSKQEMRLIGGGGVGKTVLMSHIHSNMEQWYDDSSSMDASLKRYPIFTATTNEALSVLRSKGIDAPRTIFGLAGIRPNDFTGKLTAWKPPTIMEALIFVDESSYISKSSRELILKQLPNCKIVWVLDNAQLAPVGEELPCVDTLTIPEASLSTILRSQGPLQQFNTYLRNCVLNQENPVFDNWHNGSSIKLVDSAEFQKLINEEFVRTDWSPSDSRILSFRREQTKKYCNYVHTVLRGHDHFFTEGTSLKQSGYSGVLPDGHVIIVESCNERPVRFHSGHTFKVWSINNQFEMLQNPKEFNQGLRASEENAVQYRKSEFVNLVHTYANTVHVAQGSTIKKVFVDLNDIRDAFRIQREMYRRLVYSGISRASEEVIIRIS